MSDLLWGVAGLVIASGILVVWAQVDPPETGWQDAE